uniref:Calpain-D n=1 Tax=Ascaris suum TaxID=6253 RepID=F1KW88_ASCSU
MGWWACKYCTLRNDTSALLCAACGSQNPTKTPRTQQHSILPKLPKVSITGALNAIDSALTNVGLLPPLPSQSTPSLTSTKWYTPIIDRILPPSSTYPTNPPQPCPPSEYPQPYIYPQPVATPSSQQSRGSPSALSPRRTSRGISGNRRSPSAPDIASSRSETEGAQSSAGCERERTLPSPLYSSSSIHLEKRDVQEASNTFVRITEFCRSNNIPFIDDSFPQCLKSIGDLSRNNEQRMKPKVKANELIWLRPQDMFTKDGHRYTWTVFRDPKASDIEQGSLGNCWFLSSLAVIAERPDILEQIVLTKVYNPFGIYQIRLCVDGRWQVVVVDDFFPCHARTRGLAFAVGRRNQLWVPLIEKAFAKISGSYAKLLAGRTVEGLAVLTGAPCSQLDLENVSSPDSEQMLWASLLSMREARFIMGCSCGAGKRYVDDAKYKAVGLQPRHAYSLLDVAEYNGHRLVRLRNPWGTFVWNQDWSDSWSGWTTRARAVLLPNGPEAGTFWMPFTQFLKHFDTVDVAKVRSAFGWKELRIDCTLQPSWGRHHITGVRVHLECSTEVAFTVYQAGSRQRTESDIMLLVHRVGPIATGVGELLVRSARKMAPFVSTGDVFLRGPSDYIVLPISFSNLHAATRIDLVVAVHSARPICAEKTRYPASVITESLIELALKEGQIHNTLEGVAARYVSDEFCGHLLIIDNLHENKYLQVHCDCSNSRNVLSTRFTLNTLDSIPPLHRQVVMMLNHFEPTQGYYVGHSLTQRIVSFRGLRDWVSLVPGMIALPADTEHVPPLDDPSVALLHRPRRLFQ